MIFEQIIIQYANCDVKRNWQDRKIYLHIYAQAQWRSLKVNWLWLQTISTQWHRRQNTRLSFFYFWDIWNLYSIEEFEGEKNSIATETTLKVEIYNVANFLCGNVLTATRLSLKILASKSWWEENKNFISAKSSRFQQRGVVQNVWWISAHLY